MTQKTPEELDEMIEALDTMAGMLRDPHKIINGQAEPLTNKEPQVCYAIATEVTRVLVQRAKDLQIPDTFQKAIDVWELEVDNAFKFMLENFDLELIIMVKTTLMHQYHIDIDAVNKPNVIAYNQQVKSILGDV
jgi:hypothetical protein